MGLFDWVLLIGGVIATKAAETITSEVLKNRLTESKKRETKKSLVNLYQELSLLEQESTEFADSLETFLQKQSERPDEQVIDLRWYRAWADRILNLAKQVGSRMQTVSDTIKELNPNAEIYLPDVVNFLALYPPWVDMDYSVAQALNDEYGLLESKSSPIRQARFLEFVDFVRKLQAAILGLGNTKAILADFIKSEFSFSD